MSSLTETYRQAALARRSLSRRGLVAVVLAVVANVLLRGVGGLAVPDIARAEPMSWGAIVGSSVVGAVGGVLAYGLLQRLTTAVESQFRQLAAVVLGLSMVPVLTVAPSLPGVTTPVIVILALMHVATAVAVVIALTTSLVDRPASP